MKTQLIAALLVIGLVGALAGGSTLAIFSDTEASENNVFTAGALDVQIDWEETYNGDEVETQELTSNPGPIFDLGDVKPGDEGEATISLHIFDNPGWLWLRMNMSNNDDISSTEPELGVDVPENESDQFDGELAQSILVNLWYDEDGDNIFDEGEREIFSGETCEAIETDLAIALDNSGSMNGPGTTDPEKFEAAKNGSIALVNSIDANDQGALVAFNNTANLRVPLTDDKAALNDSIELIQANGETNIRDAIETAHTELVNGSAARGDATKVLVLLSDGTPTVGGNPVPAADAAKDDGVRIITIAYGNDADTALLEQIATEGDAYEADQADVEQIFAEITQEICSPSTLEDLNLALEDGILLDGNRTEEGMQPYVNSTTQYIGFSWEIPRDVGNDIQTDETVFDMEFYGEQRRHNAEPVSPWQ